MLNKKYQIFIAYSRKDSDMLIDLKKHLASIERHGNIKIWYDGEIKPGEIWDEKIKYHLHNADIILLLISADALNSDYFWNKEVKDAIEKHEKGTAKVIPLILKSCLWQNTPFGNFQAIPKDGKPISTWNNIDDAYYDAVKRIVNMIEDEEKLKREIEEQKSKIEEIKQKEIEEQKRLLKRRLIESEERKMKEEKKARAEIERRKWEAYTKRQNKKKLEEKQKEVREPFNYNQLIIPALLTIGIELFFIIKFDLINKGLGFEIIGFSLGIFSISYFVFYLISKFIPIIKSSKKE